MTGPDWNLINRIFIEVLETTDARQREAVLKSLCGGDAELEREVQSLLAAHKRSEDWLEQSAQAEAGAALESHLGSKWIGKTLGAWQITGMIHQGGMGAVYRVQRIGADFDQTAALKIIRMGLESEDLLRRFARERQVLARLHHPNIARLFDGGTMDQGLPWLVMEYIEGEPINRWCDKRRLSISDRLQLFEQVCGAVHFAHQNLVIHRDIKPSNILVTQQGVPILLDFGIAKLLTDESEGRDVTLTRHRILTPANSSPEQFTGGPISTASDVYSLGVLLYGLLTGHPPYSIDATTPIGEIHRRICHDQPIRPSQVVTNDNPELASDRGCSPDRLRRQLRGDLDTIVLKALRKEPERRYGSVEELAEDLRRYRAGLPVHARPDSVGYRTGKFVRRHWVGLGATVAAFAALAIGLAVAMHQADQARAERDRAQLINEFLQTILIEADPYEAGAEATVRDVLRKAGELVEERFAGQPEIEAPLRHTIGYTQLSLMELDSSLENLNRADRLNRELYGDLDDRTLLTRAYIAWIDYRRGQHDAAEAGYRALMDQLGPGHHHATRATIHNDFGIVLGEMERWEEALEHQRKALDIWLAHEPDRPEIGVSYNNIAYNLHGQDQLEQAREWYERALEHQRREAPGGVSVDLAYNLNNYGVLLRDLGRVDEALPYYRESLDMRIATLGAEHAFTGFGHLNLGRLLLDLVRAEEAMPHLERALVISEATLEPDQLQVLVARASLARARSLHGGNHLHIRTELEDVLQQMRASGAPDQFIEQTHQWLEASSPVSNPIQLPP